MNRISSQEVWNISNILDCFVPIYPHCQPWKFFRVISKLRLFPNLTETSKTHLIVLYFTQSGNPQTCDTSKIVYEYTLTKSSNSKVKIPPKTLVLVLQQKIVEQMKYTEKSKQSPRIPITVKHILKASETMIYNANVNAMTLLYGNTKLQYQLI